MKHLKRTLCLILLGTIFFSLSVFAERTPQSLAAEELNKLSVMIGDGTDDLMLAKTVTRAEMAAIACRLLALSNSAKDMKVTNAVFLDVLPEHWAAGYIKFAKDNGIVNGYPDGRFCPEQEVSYQEALKILVAVIGYLPKTESYGGYPTGILAVASQIGLTQGVSFVGTDFATRGNIAVLTQNSLDIPLLVQTGFGSFLEFQVDEKTTLRSQNFN